MFNHENMQPRWTYLNLFLIVCFFIFHSCCLWPEQIQQSIFRITDLDHKLFICTKLKKWRKFIYEPIMCGTNWKKKQKKGDTNCNLNFFVASIHWQLFLSTRKIFMRMKVCRHMGTLPDTNINSNKKVSILQIVNESDRIKNAMDLLFTIPSFRHSRWRISRIECECVWIAAALLRRRA